MPNPSSNRHRNHTGLCATCRGPLETKGRNGQRYCPPCYNAERRQRRTAAALDQQAYEEVFGQRPYATTTEPPELTEARRKWMRVKKTHGLLLEREKREGETTPLNPDQPPQYWGKKRE